MKRLFSLGVLVLVLSMFSVQAQDESTVTVIPVQSMAYHMAVSPDARLIATAEQGAIHNDEVLAEYLPIRIFDSESGAELFALDDFTDYAADLAFNEDGSVLASYHGNGWIYLWDTSTGEQIRAIEAFPNAGFLQFIPETNLLVQSTTASFPLPGLLVWNTETGVIEAVSVERFDSVGDLREYANANTLPQTISAMTGASTQDSVIVATAFNDILLWNVETNTRDILLFNESENRNPYFDIRSLALIGETVIFTHNQNDVVQALNLTTQAVTTLYEGENFTVGAASDADVIAWLGGERNAPVVFVSSLANPAEVTQIPIPTPTSDIGINPAGVQVAVSADGSRIVVGGFANVVDGNNAIFVMNNG